MLALALHYVCSKKESHLGYDHVWQPRRGGLLWCAAQCGQAIRATNFVTLIGQTQIVELMQIVVLFAVAKIRL